MSPFSRNSGTVVMGISGRSCEMDHRNIQVTHSLCEMRPYRKRQRASLARSAQVFAYAVSMVVQTSEDPCRSASCKIGRVGEVEILASISETSLGGIYFVISKNSTEAGGRGSEAAKTWVEGMVPGWVMFFSSAAPNSWIVVGPIPLPGGGVGEGPAGDVGESRFCSVVPVAI